MDKDDKKLAEIRKILDEAERKIQAVKRILFEKVYQEQAEYLDCRVDQEASVTDAVIQGVFDGENMIDKSGKKYPVPSNYCSKSKLVAGDSLKLTVISDGTFLFKQIGPVDRKKLIGKLVKKGESWIVLAEDKKYRILDASVTYFKAKENDKLTIILPKVGESEWAAVDNLVEKTKV